MTNEPVSFLVVSVRAFAGALFTVILAGWRSGLRNPEVTQARGCGLARKSSHGAAGCVAFLLVSSASHLLVRLSGPGMGVNKRFVDGPGGRSTNTVLLASRGRSPPPAVSTAPLSTHLSAQPCLIPDSAQNFQASLARGGTGS